MLVREHRGVGKPLGTSTQPEGSNPSMFRSYTNKQHWLKTGYRTLSTDHPLNLA